MRLVLVFSLFFALGCGPKLTNDSEAVQDVLISFTVNAQASNYSRCLELVTYDEQLKLLAPGGDVKEEYRTAMNRMRLSALQQYNFQLDSEGRLVGMYAALVDANRKFQISDEQRSLSLKDIEQRQRDRVVADSLQKASTPPTEPQLAPVQTPESESEEGIAPSDTPVESEAVEPGAAEAPGESMDDFADEYLNEE